MARRSTGCATSLVVPRPIAWVARSKRGASPTLRRSAFFHAVSDQPRWLNGVDRCPAPIAEKDTLRNIARPAALRACGG